MITYKCNNCESIFTVNEDDERVESGAYPIYGEINCGLCDGNMQLIIDTRETAE